MSGSGPAPLRIDAIVAASERPALAAVADQLRDCLSTATGRAWDVAVRFRESFAALDPQELPTWIVASMLPGLAGDEAMTTIEGRWREQLACVPSQARSSVLLCTIFRHVAVPRCDGQPDARPAIRERLRRLNLMAIQLSHEAGVGVIDIDRAFSQQGARLLQADCSLEGTVAAAAAAHAIVSAILRTARDDVLAPEVQQQALQVHGDLRDLVARL